MTTEGIGTITEIPVRREPEDKPSGLRKTVERSRKTIKRQADQIEHLTRMVLLERIKDADVDLSEALHLLDVYRPDWTGDAKTFGDQFSVTAIDEWLAAWRNTT